MSLPVPVQGAVIVWDSVSGGAVAATGIVIDGLALSAPQTNLPLITPQVSGLYLVSVYMRCTTAAAGGHKPVSTMGPVTISFTCPDAGLPGVITLSLDDGAGNMVTTNSTNTVNSWLTGSGVINAQVGVPITTSIGYASTGTTAMQYSLHIKCVFLGGLPE